jgi:two-component system phosphate regulon sensor histidine kinase PhoR
MLPLGGIGRSLPGAPVISLLPRVVAALGLGVAGGALGYVVGALRAWPALGAIVGAALGVAWVVGSDALRGRRLLKWLRGSQDTAAPRDTGFWGELGYRIERAFRQLERDIVVERRRLDQFLSAMEASPNGVLLIDANEQIDWCNSVAATHFDLHPDRDRHQRVTNLVRAPAFKAYLTDERFDEPVQFAAPDGRSTLSVLVRPYGDGLKLVLSQDITERERTDAMRRDFVANVSHEIRTPLTVLAGFVETMNNLPLSESERRRVLTLMAQQTDRMQTLVSDLLALAQLEGSPRPAADRWVPLASVMQRAESDALSLSAGRHRIQVDRAAGVEIAGSDVELMSAVGNLLNNAVRYTPEGGNIQVRWVAQASGAGHIEVVDSGLGVAREHIPRLTERFYRVDGSRSRETGGTGLGLSIVKHVMQRHGGQIEIDSEPGHGSCFRLVFPRARLRNLRVADGLTAAGAATLP